MNWEAIAAIGEIIGAIAVVITLVYLTIQLRQNTAAVATATQDSVTAGFNAVNQAVISDEKLAEIFLRGTATPESLTAEESVRFSFLMRSWANQWLKLYRLRKSGAITALEWKTHADEAAEAFRTPGGALFRKQNAVFAELWTELDRFGGRQVSSVRLGVAGASPGSQDSGTVNESETTPSRKNEL